MFSLFHVLVFQAVSYRSPTYVYPLYDVCDGRSVQMVYINCVFVDSRTISDRLTLFCRTRLKWRIA